MPKWKTPKVSIDQTRCGRCALLESRSYIVKGEYKTFHTCPRNQNLPEQIEPWFGQKCELFKPKT